MSLSFEYRALLDWHAKNGRHDLPWRDFNGSIEEIGYRVWLSEILLQQTQADRCIAFYNRILDRFPTLESLAKANYDTFFPYYQGLGYYSRARNLLATAKKVVSDFGGTFPRETKLLRNLPGVGPYTTEAIRAFAYDIPTLAFDTNLEKVFARYFHGSRFLPLSEAEKRQILSDFEKNGLSSRTVNAALMDFANLHSKNQKELVDHLKSPFQNCRFTNTKGSLEETVKKPIRYFPSKDARIVVTLHENHRIYFSSLPDRYAPFTLPPSEEDSRASVQTYFLENHALILSVRPPHKKEYIGDVPHLFVNAQIQQGMPKFRRFGKGEI